ncbi:hypothetical protein H6G27_32280 [Nostoc linckia FACHB-104]|nr:hypothetical protein [Nostoc linckia FACHB-104]
MLPNFDQNNLEGEGVTQVCFSPDRKTIVGNAKNTLKLWNLDTQESKIFSDITGANNGISFSSQRTQSLRRNKRLRDFVRNS